MNNWPNNAPQQTRRAGAAGCGCATAIVGIIVAFQVIGVLAEVSETGFALGFLPMITIAMIVFVIFAIVMVVRAIAGSSGNNGTNAGRSGINTGNPGNYHYSRPQSGGTPSTVNYYYQTVVQDKPAPAETAPVPSVPHGSSVPEIVESSPQVRFCRNCGETVEPTDRFCPYCGKQL